MCARTPAAALLLAAAALTSCGSGACDLAPGCLRADAVCECAEWQTARVESVPVKFVVISVDHGVIGNQSTAVYGFSSGTALPSAWSELGSRIRAVVRAPDGTERVAALDNAEVGTNAGPFVRVTPATGAFRIAGGDGQTGSAVGISSPTDVPSPARDQFQIWVNPTLEVTTDVAGHQRTDWGWTAVGGCFFTLFPCDGPAVLPFTAEQIEGTVRPGAPGEQAFLDSLTDAERQAILRMDVLHDPPGRDPASLAADPRLLRIGSATFDERSASFTTPSWTPCAGTLRDDAFEVLARTEVPFARSSQTLLVDHGVMSSRAACSEQRPGLALASSNPGCAITADVYVDRMFGTLLFVPGVVAPGCTGP